MFILRCFRFARRFNFRTASLAGLLILLLLPGCDEDKTRLDLTATGFEARHLYGEIGQHYSFEIRFTDAQGRPRDPVLFYWTGAASPDMPKDPEAAVLITSHPSEGVYRIDYTPLRENYTVFSCNANFCDGTLGCPTQSFGNIVLEVFPEIASIQPVVADPLRIAVGERRNLPALTWGYTGDAPNHMQAAYGIASDNPAVASIDGHTVTGVAPGTTTLTFTCELAPPSTVTVEVVEAPLAPPGDGAHPALEVPVYNQRGYDPEHTQRLALDSQGLPVFVARPDPGILNVDIRYLPGLVAEWTGAGFEAQFIGRFGETVDSPQLTLDERDRRYVLYRARGYTLRHFVLAERAADGGPDDWTYRDLPTRPWLDRSEEPNLERREPSLDQEFTTSLMAILPRVGGGVWVAYVINGFELAGMAQDNAFIPCQLTLRLAEVTDDGIIAHDVGRWITGEHFGRCDHDFGMLALGPPQPGDGFPTLVTNGGCSSMSADTLAMLFLGTEYEGYELGPLPPPTPQYANRFFFHDGRWQSELFMVDPDDPEATRDVARYPLIPRSGEAEWFGRAAFAFLIEGTRWYGGWEVGPLRRHDPVGGVYWDDATPRWAPSDEDYGQTWESAHRNWLVVGSAHDDVHLTELIAVTGTNQLQFVRTTPARKAGFDDADTLGRLVVNMNQPWLWVGPALRTAAGATLAVMQRPITDNYGRYNPDLENWLGAGRVVRQATADGPFELLVDQAGLGFRIVEAGGRVFMTRNQDLLVSDDAGSTFATTTTVPASVRDLSAVGASVWLAAQAASPMLLFSPDAGATPWVDLLLGSGETAPLNFRLLPGGDDLLVLLLRNNRQLRVLRYDLTGALLDDDVLDFANPVSEQLRGARLDDGFVIFDPLVPGLLAWTPGATGFVNLAPLPANFMIGWPLGGGLPVLQLPSGRLVAGGVVEEYPDRRRAALVTSDDGGLTWSAPHLVRPDGGEGQRFVAIGLAGDALLLSLWDNASMRAFEFNDTESLDSMPQFDQVYLSLPVASLP